MAFYIAAIIASVLAMTQVKTNYDLVDYLPDDVSSTVGLNLMDEEFDSKPANLRIMLPDVTVAEALEAKKKLASIKGVKDVTWLDDTVDVVQPLEMIDEDIINSCYKDGNALITAYVSPEASNSVVSEIRALLGDDAAIAGDQAQAEESRRRTSTDIAKMLVIAVPIIFVILFLTTTSIIEPVLFLASIGVAILLGKGTDLIFGEISFVTSSCSAILQLATSMDYAIFLIESFESYREKGLAVEDAMVEAMNQAFSSIFSSSLTTVFGFLALTMMRFGIGYDLGLVLAKSIVMSLFAIMTLLPVLTIMANGVMERTRHKKWVSSFNGFGRLNARICIPVSLVIGTVVVMPSILAYMNNDYIYGTTQMIVDPSIRVVQDQNAIDELYEKSNQMVLMVPYGQPAREQALIDELDDMDDITSITAYATMADTTIPVDFVGRENLKQLIGENYSRIIISADMELESEKAFKFVEDIRTVAEKYYPNDAYLTGGTSNIYDMRDVVIQDDVIVNQLSMAAIGI
ncbi:MAG: MMPL family transporter, partial [Clostridia bacterium]|nr:MMPL family transporter [Clostridia bacterium]